MGAHDLVHDREAQARPFRIGRAGGVEPHESLEDPPPVLGRDAGPAIRDLEDYRTAVPRDAHLDLAVASRVAERVRQEVRDDARESGAVSRNGRALDGLDAAAHAAAARERRRVRRRLRRHGREIDRLPAPGERRVSAGEQQQRVHLLRETAGGALDRLERAPRLLRRRVRPERLLRLADEHGGRRLQLVRRVGDEAALRAERVLEPVEERVDDGREPPELLAALRDADAPREVRRLELFGEARDLLDGADGARHGVREDRRRAEKAEEHDRGERAVEAREALEVRADPAEEDERRAPSPFPTGA